MRGGPGWGPKILTLMKAKLSIIACLVIILSSCGATDKEKARYERQIKEKEKRITNLEKKVDKLQKEISNKEDEICELEDRIYDLEHGYY